MGDVISKIIAVVVFLLFAYVSFKWNKKHKQNIWLYLFSAICLLGAFMMPFAQTEEPETEATSSSSSSSSEAELESEASAASESKQKSSSKKQSDDTNTRNELDTAVNFINNQNDAVKAAVGQNNKSIILTVNDTVAEVAKNAANDQSNQDNWIKFTGEINKLTESMLTGKYNIKVPFIIQAQDGTKLMESKHGYTVYDIMDTE
ncbi:hypothetical protein SN811_08090 [Ligilactobacillus agilis]|uniref:Uncharacterized protein n=2 Tax=Ligilactobacillus agilis TaxID=1601 RepID=A0A6F9Y463_9LACO|nr:hypothetical protein SN811_08090 [Ligilactobacillus agilis]